MPTPQDAALVLSAHLANSNAHRAHRDLCSQGTLYSPRETHKQTLERVDSEILFRVPIEKRIGHTGWSIFTVCMGKNLLHISDMSRRWSTRPIWQIGHYWAITLTNNEQKDYRPR